MIRCPKCLHEQANQEECEACGLLFRRFEQIQERERQKLAASVETVEVKTDRSNALGKIGSILALMALTAGITYWLAGGAKTPQQPSAPPQVVQPVAPAPVEARQERPVVPATPSPKPQPVSLPRPEVTSTGSIEQAKMGTVAIETPWGTLGSGFFLTDNLIVTNKHVVEQDGSKLKEFDHKVKTNRQMINLELQQIAEIRERLKTIPDGPVRRELQLILQEKERALAKALPSQEEAEKRLREMERPRRDADIKIFLADGSEHKPQGTIQKSAKLDLALIAVYGSKAKPLKAAPKEARLREGDKVYTVGNPSGLRHTVTAGIFSGYRQNKETGEIVLQTDAPINPGNSGGPLIDDRGQVHGVNYMIYRDTQGIGFAIPIQAVFDEFVLSR